MDEIEAQAGLQGVKIISNEVQQEFLELLVGMKGVAINSSNKDYIEPELGLKGVSIQFIPHLFPHKLER